MLLFPGNLARVELNNQCMDGCMDGCSPYLSKDKDMLTLMIKIYNFNTEG